MNAPVVYSNQYTFVWPGHVFPTGKYAEVARELVAKGLVTEFCEPVAATRAELLTCHDEEYLDRLERIADGRERVDPRFECPVNRTVLDAFKRSAGGTILACRLAAAEGWAANIGGGFHHAYPDHGEGFCILNDVMVGAKAVLAQGLAPSVLVVDLDVHQGNGTAVMARDEERIYTLSLHQENNYPPKEDSDLDVGLRDGCDDGEYLTSLDWALRAVEDKFETGFVIYLAGADVYREDRLGGLGLTMEGLWSRDQLVFDWAERHGVPVAALLAGGYAVNERDVVEIHVAMIEDLLSRWAERQRQTST